VVLPFGNKYTQNEDTPTMDQEPPLVQFDGHHLRPGLELGLVDRRGTLSIDGGGGFTIPSHSVGLIG